MEPADADRNSRLAQRPGEVHRARELVRLDPDQRDQPLAASRREGLDDLVGGDPQVGFVVHRDADLDPCAQDLPLVAVTGNAVEAASVFEGMSERTHWIT